MVENKYAIAYSEVLEILKHIPIEDYNKIPKSKIELFETNAEVEIDDTKWYKKIWRKIKKLFRK